MKNVLIISSTPRKNGNSERLCQEFRKGAQEAGHQVELVCLRDLEIGYCRGCFACAELGRCVIDDDMQELAQKVRQADVLVLATPVYFYSMSGQLKVFIDRLVPVYEQVRAEIYLFCTAADSNIPSLAPTLEAIRGLTRDCFEDCEEKYSLAVGEVNEIGDIEGKSEALTLAYNMGLDC